MYCVSDNSFNREYSDNSISGEYGDNLCQVDGNVSVKSFDESEDDEHGRTKYESEPESSSDDDGEDEFEDENEDENEDNGDNDESEASNIPVMVGNRSAPPYQSIREPIRKTIRRSNSLVEALSAPRSTLYNVWSAWAKWNNIAEDIENRETDVCFLTEVWEKAESKKHQKAAESMLEMKGIKYVSTPRPGVRRGGGTALACSERLFHMTKLNISIPSPLEACFALLKPKNPTGKINKFICCSFYLPPKSRYFNKLAEFLVTTLGLLRTEHPGCRVLMAGDKNDMKMGLISSLDPTLKQLVQKNTTKNKTKVLDVFYTDCADLLQEPEIVPQMKVDEGKVGKDSDHYGVQVLPRTNLAPQGPTRRERITVQRFPESRLEAFGYTELAQEDWSRLKDSRTTTTMVDEFEAVSERMINQAFPKKEILVGPDDLPYYTEELRQLKRRKIRAYTKYGQKSTQYNGLQNQYQEKLKVEAMKYTKKVENEVMEGKRGSAYSAIRKLGNRPGEEWRKPEFTLPSFVEENLSPSQAADRLAEHFSAVSQTCDPLNESLFHPALKQALENGRKCGNKPIISQHDVYRKILKATKPNSSVQGDVPRQLIMKYPYQYALPASLIFNKIIQDGDWPRQWVHEKSIAISKMKATLPRDEDDLRSLSKTAFFSKCCESMLGDFILPIVDQYLDPGQCGGLKKTSTNHYLVKLLDFAQRTLDKNTPHCAVLCTEDISKPYNLGSHTLVIEDLFSMHVPGWILLVVCSYLRGRSMTLKYQGQESANRPLPGGFGAGTWLGGLLFIIKFNGACLRPPIPRPITGNQGQQFKFVDDATQIVSVNLKRSLVMDPVDRPRPLNFHERTQMILDETEDVLQSELNKIAGSQKRTNWS